MLQRTDSQHIRDKGLIAIRNTNFEMSAASIYRVYLQNFLKRIKHSRHIRAKAGRKGTHSACDIPMRRYAHICAQIFDLAAVYAATVVKTKWRRL